MRSYLERKPLPKKHLKDAFLFRKRFSFQRSVFDKTFLKRFKEKDLIGIYRGFCNVGLCPTTIY
jgi:hypothetical protein